MANVVPFAFPVELLKGSHDFANDNYNLALYTANPYTNEAGAQAATVYSATSEVSASGGSQYTARGNLLTGNAVSNVNDVATVDFTNTAWGTVDPATFSAAFGLIFNVTDGDKLVVLLDFGGTKSCSNGTFTITFPSPTAGTPSGSDALLSITS
jgi:hypothetical protein